MSTPERDNSTHLPAGYRAVPISPDADGAAGEPLRLCVLARREPDPVGGVLVVLRRTLDARVYLGCVADTAGRVVRWVEIWVQTVEGLAQAPASAREGLTNAALDERWRRQVEAFELAAKTCGIEHGGVIRTGWETKASRPLWIDGASGKSVVPGDKATGKAMVLCTDDAALSSAKLPTYSSTLHRYLWTGAIEGGFVPVSQDAPTSERTRALTSVLPEGLSVLSAEGGRMMVRACAPVALESYAEALSRAGDAQMMVRLGVQHGRTLLDIGAGEAVGESGGVGTDAGLFMGRHGRWGRLVETLHLKLRAWADCVDAVRVQVEATQRPLLNVRPESFQVRLDAPARGLPRWWTSRVLLADPGESVPLPVPLSDAAYFVPAAPSKPSIFRAASSGSALGVGGRAQLRIRQVMTQKSEELVLEGTFATQERLTLARNDLVWVRLNLGAAGGVVDLYAKLETDRALAAGEWRLRTLAHRLPGRTIEALRASEGVPLNDVAFETAPQLSSPCDLYSLGVLGVRMLLVGPDNTLATALDEALSLARAAGSAGDQERPLHERVLEVFRSDARWLGVLGPQRLTAPALPAEEALNLVPVDLWMRVLACLVRMFPGAGTDAICKDLGDARVGGLHLPLEEAAAAMDDLLRRTRSLIVIDWNANREIHAVIRRYATGVGVRAPR